jgi:hexosaminidase
MNVGATMLLVLTTTLSTPDARFSLMPWPSSLEPASGGLSIDPGFRVTVSQHCGPRVHRAAQRLEARLARQTGMELPAPGAAADRRPTLRLHCENPARTVWPSLDMDERYTLEVRPEGATLRAPEPWGVLRGIETFLQLVEPGGEAFHVPAITAHDAPRFPWRGLLIDSCRHFMPVESLKRTLDAMAAVKLNVLHWHLTEDQGFRVESRRFPRLHQLGSDGRFYSQEQLREVVAYAADRGIRVVPEFDMPGHTTSWFVGHPELATLPGPYSIERRWGIMDPAVDPSREEVYQLLEGFLGEMAGLFPDAYLHIGGDEVNGKHWDRSERVRAFKKQHGLKDNHDLQAHFLQRVAELLGRHGKQVMGWDEVLHPGLPTDAVVHSWRGHKSLAEAARQGFRGVLSSGYYLDHNRPAWMHYEVDPLGKDAAGLSPEEAARILGGEACMWTEFVTPELLDSRLWPRAATVAERLWSPREVKDTEDMYRRLEATSRWLEWLGLEHRTDYPRMLERLAGADAPVLRELADIVEPLEFYDRHAMQRETSLTPLNRLVDVARPESDAARHFSRLVERLLADPSRQAGREAVRERLTIWKGLAPRLRPLLERSPLLREVLPLTQELTELAEVGLRALEQLDSGKPARAAWWKRREAVLETPSKPPHALELAIRPAVRRLMEAASEGPRWRRRP